MNNDLISRKAVIKIIDELGYINCHNGRDFEANNRVDKIRQKIVEQPTAFDFESMIEQMEGRLERIRKEQSADCLMYDGYCTPEQSMRRGMIKAILEDLEILKLAANEVERTGDSK